MTLLLASTAAEPTLALLKELSFTEDDFYSMTTEDLARTASPGVTSVTAEL